MKNQTKISEDIIRKAKEKKNSYNRENKQKLKRRKEAEQCLITEKINNTIDYIETLESLVNVLKEKVLEMNEELQPKGKTKEEIKKLKNLEYCRRWREKNKDHIKEYSKKYWINKVLKEEEN
jgi:vacuolar-type H+-ATPase subunit I/STV1